MKVSTKEYYFNDLSELISSSCRFVGVMTFNIYANIKSDSIYTETITIEKEELIAMTTGYIITIPFGSSTGGIQALPIQSYKSTTNKLTITWCNPYSVDLVNTQRQGYMSFFFK